MELDAETFKLLLEHKNDAQIIVGIPLSIRDKPDPIYLEPLIENCPICKEQMWTSKRKRDLRDRCNLLICCVTCCVALGGNEENYYDMTQIN